MKKKIEIEKWRLLCAIVCFVMMGVMIGTCLCGLFPVVKDFNVKKAYASGSSNVTLVIPAVAYTRYFASPTNTTDDFWSNCISTETPDSWNASVYQVWCGWATAGNVNEYTVYWGGATFAVPEYLQGADISSAYVAIYSGNKNSNYAWEQQYALWTGFPTDPTSWVSADGNNWDWVSPAERVSNLFDYDDVGNSAYHIFYLEQGRFATGDYSYLTDAPSGNCTFYLMTPNQALKYAPAWQDTKYRKANFNMNPAGANPPLLIVNYVENTPERVVRYNENAGVDTTTDGSEVADNITWDSPRCAYADDVNGMYWVVHGDSGASISLVLKDGNGNILDEHEDSVRLDGKYNYLYDPPDNWYGYVRLYETTHNLHTDWGYCMPAPFSSQQANTVYAVSTEDPQYDYAFSRYLTYEDDLFVLHWKSNIQEGENADHDLWLTSNGANTTKLYDQDFQTLADDYYQCSDNNSYLLAHRFAILCPNIEGSGFNDMDDLIIDMDVDYSSAYSGFMQGLIVDTTDNTTLADSHSCYWYIPEEIDGLIMTLNKSEYTFAEEMNLNINVGQACKAVNYLPSLTIEVLDDTGSALVTSYQTFLVGSNDYIIESPSTAGDYEIRLTFSGSGTWDYIHDIPFSVVTRSDVSGSDSIVRGIDNWITNLGLDNPMGYWLILLIGMVLLFLLFYKSEILRVVMPLVFLGAMLIWEYIDAWMIILLALGAGLTIFGLLRKKISGGGG